MKNLKYILKKFAYYLIYAVTGTAYLITLLPFAVIFGGPAILLTALCLAISDGMRLQVGEPTMVFDRAFFITWGIEVSIVVAINAVYFITTS